MSDDTGKLTIVFNGEIYNYRSLRKDLERLGQSIRTETDTEIILGAYREWGTDCLSRLNGMFAFALYDDQLQRLFLARDRAGKKPFFYRHACGKFFFSSELKGIMEDPTFQREIDLLALEQYLAYGYVIGERSILQGVRKVGAGKAMIYDLDLDSLEEWTYWDLPAPFSGTKREKEDLIFELENLLSDAVSMRLVADVPVGVLLSGGIDSSLVTAFAARNSSGKVKTFTIAFPGHGTHDEGPYARLVASHFGTDHSELIAEPATVELLPLLARQFDEPIGDHSIVPTYIVSRLIRQYATVALGGDGGDELFGGYPHYNLLHRIDLFRQLIPGRVRRLVGHVAACCLPLGTRGRNHLIGTAGESWNSLAHVNMYFDDLSRRRLLVSLFRKSTGRTTFPEETKSTFCSGGGDLLQDATRMDFKTTLRDGYLVKVDRSSMLASLEVRSPFLDHRIIEFAFGQLPGSFRATSRERKVILRILASRLLPPGLDLSRKQGFTIPLESWMKGEWGGYFRSVLSEADRSLFDRDVIRDLFEGQEKGYRNEGRLFLLTMFELWRREYKASLPQSLVEGNYPLRKESLCPIS